MAGLIATKLEMTRVIKGDKFVPVTILEIPEIRVVWIKTNENDGYKSLILWVCDKEQETTLWENKKTLNIKDFSIIKEFSLNEDEEEKYKVWDVVTLDILDWVELVSVEWVSKWRWFAWAMKRHNFHWGPGGHGSKFHRALWSIGNRKPTRTHKGKKMHGHYGVDKVTLKKLPLDLVNKEMWVVWVRWGVPGARNSLVKIMF